MLTQKLMVWRLERALKARPDLGLGVEDRCRSPEGAARTRFPWDLNVPSVLASASADLGMKGMDTWSGQKCKRNTT